MKFPNEFVLVFDVKEDAAKITSTLDKLGFEDTHWEFSHKYFYVKNMEVMWVLGERYLNDKDLLDNLPHITYSSLLKGSIPWDAIKEEFKYVAMEEDGEWWAFEQEPEAILCEGVWDAGWLHNYTSLEAIKMPSHEGHWKDSLTKRPE